MNPGELPVKGTSASCSNCGASLTYLPGTAQLTCGYCGARNEIASAKPAKFIENDYETHLALLDSGIAEKEQLRTVACASCGAAATLAPNVTSDNCPFCGVPIIISQAQVQSIIKPRYLLPFTIDRLGAHAAVNTWIGRPWFIPGRLKRDIVGIDSIRGVYLPYWTYDAKTDNDFTGERGVDRTVHYTTRENGKTVTRTRTVTEWAPVSGSFDQSFDDVLVIASHSLPQNYSQRLEPWDLHNLVEFNNDYLAGFQTEAYRIGLEEGFDQAQTVMDKTIRETVRQHIGGDHQRITTVATKYDSVTFKHILLPVWISVYRYRDKAYRFMVNARTGEVQGERPWSVPKIIGAAIAAVAVLSSLLYAIHAVVQR